MDLNANGIVGQLEHVDIGGFTDVASSDLGDTFLAAQVLAVASAIPELSAPGVQFGIVAVSVSRASGKASGAIIHAELTHNTPDLLAALDTVLENGSWGTSDFAAGLGAAIRVLGSPERANPEASRRVIFMSDSTKPTLRLPDGTFSNDDPRIEREVQRALDSDIVIDTLKLGEAEMGAPSPTLRRMAHQTGGSHTNVADLQVLNCEIAKAIAGD